MPFPKRELFSDSIVKQSSYPRKSFRHSIFSRSAILVLLFLFSGLVAASALQLELWEYPRWLEPGEKVDRFAWVKHRLKQFEAENPGITVKLTELTWARGDEKLKIAALGGCAPDLAPGTVPLLYIREELVIPVDEYMTEAEKADLIPAARQAYTVNGKLYGWPWYMGGQLLFANKAMCASAGVVLPSDGRWTVEEFRTVLTRVKVAQKGESGAFPLGIYFHKDQTANFPFAFPAGCGWLEGDLKQMIEKAAAEKAERATVSGLEWLGGLISDGLIPPDSGGRNSNDIWIAFAREQRLGFGAFGLWAVKALIDKYPMSFEIMHFPAQKDQVNPAYVGVSGFYAFRRGDATRTEAAMKLARFLTNAESQRALKAYTQFPTRTSAGNIYEGDGIMTRAWEVVREGRTVPVDARWPQVDEEIEVAVQETLLGSIKAPEALKNAGDRIKILLERESGAVHEELRRGSWIGKLFLYAFPLVLLFALLTRQIHLFFLIPSFTILALFLFYPLLDAILLAFRDFKFGEVGGYTMQNFARAWGDPKFRMAAWNTGLYTLIVVPANVLTALVASSLIYHLSGRWKGFFRAMYYLPGVASVVVLSMVWRWLFNTELGLFNSILRFLGMQPVGWLTDPAVAFTSVMLTGILRSPGGAILIYLASLANVPKSLYEMADLEGASKLRQWWAITIPLMRHTTMFLLITGAIDALQVFAQVLMLTDGGPGMATEVVVHRIYTAAFRDFDFGVSSAMALMLFVVIFLVTVAQRRWGASDSMELA